MIDLFSNVGGLLGLCMGFSFLSVIEIFYFLCCGILFAKTSDPEPVANAAKVNSGGGSAFSFAHPEFAFRNVVKISGKARSKEASEDAPQA